MVIDRPGITKSLWTRDTALVTTIEYIELAVLSKIYYLWGDFGLLYLDIYLLMERLCSMSYNFFSFSNLISPLTDEVLNL